MKIESVKDLELISREYSKKLYYPEAIKVNIGMASCGIAAGAEKSFLHRSLCIEAAYCLCSFRTEASHTC